MNFTTKLKTYLVSHLRFNKTDNQWHTQLFYALSLSLPFVIGIYFQQLQVAILVVVGMLTIFLKSMKASLPEKMRQVFLSGVLLSAFFGLGVQLGPYKGVLFLIIPPVIYLIYKLAYWARFKSPGQFFIFIAFMVGTYSRIDETNYQLILISIGYILTGTFFAMLGSYIYHYLACSKMTEKTISEPINWQYVGALAIIVPVAFLAGDGIADIRPYWAPISAFSVLEGMEFSHISQRLMNRLTGTFIGLLISPAILELMTSPIMAMIIFSLSVFFLVFFLFRNYLLTMVVATPVTLIICSANQTVIGPLTQELMQERLFLVIIGGFIGWLGAYLFSYKKWKWAF
ncbi:FUSC family protein [Persicobacter psychrovividus]|uniref:Integral membrane bound transporter domain-containing protein n=1 Tax=Persicobacter psychrovividus TaxID=387638 RepID=A0ABM7VJM3_9BACT|nr:hypothetical protein PEPS_34720 [Persicobacter psychrovividus]